MLLAHMIQDCGVNHCMFSVGSAAGQIRVTGLSNIYICWYIDMHLDLYMLVYRCIDREEMTYDCTSVM